ncbi:MAG: MFS transporter [Thermoleophilaceae bacterium]|nr:MFS transporter [Thermoleophilaceae bacterium]
MSRAIDLLRNEPRARVFFAALAQSSLGTGAAYVALLVVAFDRFHSGWAIGLVLFADLVPSMLFGPVFGAAADRWSRRSCLVVADLVRAAAFLGIALVDGFVPTVVLAMVAGAGTTLFTPAALAALPSLVNESRLPPATALFGAVADLGFIAGPAIAAGALLLGGPDVILIANSATFAASAIALVWLRFGAAPAAEQSEARKGLLREAREGLGAVLQMAGVRAVIAAGSAMLLFAGLFNVAELPFVRDDLDGGDAGFALLTAIYGIGFVGGSLSGSKGGHPGHLKRRFLIGLAVVGVGFTAFGAAPGLAMAGLALALAGVGNGLMLVYERLLIQVTAPDRLMARVFGVRDALTAWAFAAAFLAAGGLVQAIGARALILIAGVGGLAVWAGSRVALRKTWADESGEPDELGEAGLARRRGTFRGGAVGEEGADTVGGSDGGSALLDRTH